MGPVSGTQGVSWPGPKAFRLAQGPLWPLLGYPWVGLGTHMGWVGLGWAGPRVLIV
jgi:hypothetical protein